MGNELQGLGGKQEAIWNLLSPCGSWEATGKMATGMNDSDREEKCKRWNQQDVMTHCLWEITGKEAGGCVGRCFVPFTETRTLAEKALSGKMNSVLDTFV